jgi:hypothetical protein
MNNPVLYADLLDIRTLRAHTAINNENEASGTKETHIPRTINTSIQRRKVVSFHNDLSIFPRVDEAGLNGRVPVNVTEEKDRVSSLSDRRA